MIRIFLADVLLIYHTDRRDKFEDKIHQRRFDASIGRLNEYFGKSKLSEISQALTDGYVKDRGSPGGARRDLENLRAATGSGEWESHMRIDETFVPWTATWLYYFEEWLESDDWKGGGEHPPPEEAETYNRRARRSFRR